MVARFEVYLVTLDPTVGSEIRKTRPCTIVSPDEINQHLRTVVVAPMTSKSKFGFTYRIATLFKGKKGEIALDQLRTVDKNRLVKKLGKLNEATARATSKALVEMFTY